MSVLLKPQKVKLIASIFSSSKDILEKAEHELLEAFGDIDFKSDLLFFDKTRYYEKEMGWPLYRFFYAFKYLIDPGDLADIKIKTNDIESAYTENTARKVNIDPGYISPERLVLATGKNFTHRIYIAKGIYADLTLIFQKGGFLPLPWTFPDYATMELRDMFADIRNQYMNGISKNSEIKACDRDKSGVYMK